MTPQRVLVVDDEKIVRTILRRFLESQGHSVEEAEDGQQAIERFRPGGCDILISDLNMPRLGGLELVKRLKIEAPGLITIVLTGYATLDGALDLMKSGCDEVLLKPIENMELLAHAIGRCLDRRDALLRAASAIRVSQAKDKILGIVCEEVCDRLAEFNECLTQLEKSNQAGDPGTVSAFAGDLGAIHDRLVKSMSEIATVCQRLRQPTAEAALKREGNNRPPDFASNTPSLPPIGQTP